ncbi:rhomboid family intramembrane serine protease [Epibacterium ulvae]|uniref:rhomboid family intramembrane serine protease n=1 Tax=Epibacterium ulvae TaxID=1156985 RepID=UPI001BFC9EA9|nr:rhomboid family intramembrane serine protease [Epibacterium ulvae]MBT8155034.1 rhomboid family intramembrane serine protease [Epibacterium ulvae]
MSNPDTQSPFNTIPAVVVALALVIIGIEAVFSLGARGIVGGPAAIGWRLDALQSYAFSGEIFWWMVDTQRWSVENLLRCVSYLFVHGSFTQALFVCVFLLALGKMVAEVFGEIRMLLVFLLSGISGALIYATVGSDYPLIGGFPAVYGLIGAFTFVRWIALGAMGEQQARAFSLIGMLMGIQLLFGLILGGRPDWVADIAGFATGFGVSFFLVPGGWQRILQKIRRD